MIGLENLCYPLNQTRLITFSRDVGIFSSCQLSMMLIHLNSVLPFSAEIRRRKLTFSLCYVRTHVLLTVRSCYVGRLDGNWIAWERLKREYMGSSS